MAMIYYFLRQDKTNFINYYEEVTIGKVSKKEKQILLIL